MTNFNIHDVAKVELSEITTRDDLTCPYSVRTLLVTDKEGRTFKLVNGWKNKETWLVNLWMGDYLADLQADGAELSPEFIQETVEEWCREIQGNSVESGFIVDLFNCALGEIDYQELSNFLKG